MQHFIPQSTAIQLLKLNKTLTGKQVGPLDQSDDYKRSDIMHHKLQPCLAQIYCPQHCQPSLHCRLKVKNIKGIKHFFLLFSHQTATATFVNYPGMPKCMQYVVILFWYHLVIGFNKSDCYFVLWWLTIIACQTSVLIACAKITQVAL